jgi:Ca2+-binding RTX toxin-like protein
VLSSVTWVLGVNQEDLTLTGGTGINGTGNDLNNYIDGNAGDNFIFGDAGIDSLFGGAGNDTLDGGAGNDGLSGGAGNDTLDGGAGDDMVTDLAGDDVLAGGTGVDILRGGPGNDTLIGGDGNDIFEFDTALNAASNIKTIQDFGGAGAEVMDVIKLYNAIFTSITAGGALAAGSFVSGVGPVAADGDDHILYDTGTGSLYYDADGNGAGAAIHFAVLTDSPDALAASDFMVV